MMACSSPQNHRVTTTATFNLKGDIESFIIEQIAVISLDNHAPDKYAHNTVNRTEYHFKDNKLSKFSISIKNEEDTDYHIINEYYNIDNLKSDLHSTSISGDTITAISYVVYDKPDSMLIKKINYDNSETYFLSYYDKNGLLNKDELKFIRMKISSTKAYNKNNDIERVEQLFEHEKASTERKTTMYKYLEFDSNNNWIKRIYYYEQFHGVFMETRTIYYR